MTARTIFWDVDTQHDFMRPDGLLYVSGSEEIVAAVRTLTEHAHAHGITIVASADDHEPGHRELSDTPDFRETFPPHCMRGTAGQRKIPETALRDPLVIEPVAEAEATLRARVRGHRGDILFHKHWFDVFTNPNVATVVSELAPTRIVLYGVALDVCNRYAIEGILGHFPSVALELVTDAVRAIDPASAERLLADWRARGVKMTTVPELTGAAGE